MLSITTTADAGLYTRHYKGISEVARNTYCVAHEHHVYPVSVVEDAMYASEWNAVCIRV